MTKLVLVDHSHLCHRCAFTHSDLTVGSQPTGMMYGVFKSLMKVKSNYPLAHVVLVLDAGHLRRDIESAKGVADGIIPEAYKENRKKSHGDAYDLVKYQMSQQWDLLEEGLNYTCFQQIKIKDQEADDVIATITMNTQDPVTIVTSDKDFYQLLEPGITMYDAIKDENFTYEKFKETTGLLSPQQWVDVKSLMGDPGDGIYGVPGVGEKTALKMIVEHKSIQNLFEYLKKQKELGTSLSKRELAVLEHEKRVYLAYSLAKMDDCLPNLPEIMKSKQGDSEKLSVFFKRFQFESLYDSTEKFMIGRAHV